MIRFAALALAAVELGAGFGSATATVVSTTEESMIVEFHVEVGVAADAVVVHLVLADEDPTTIPMVPRQDGTFGVTTEVKSADYQVVFEALGDPGAESDPVTLSDLGVELGAGSGSDSTETTGSEEPSPGTQRWLWLGVALGAASLSALAFWVLGARDTESVEPDDVDEPDDEQDSPERETTVP